MRDKLERLLNDEGGWSDPEECHYQEDQILWAFVEHVALTPRGIGELKLEAAQMLAWNEFHNKRTRWYA